MNNKIFLMEFNSGRSLSLEFNQAALPLIEQQLKLSGAVKENDGIDLSTYLLEGERLVLVNNPLEGTALFAAGEKAKAVLKKFANGLGIA
jgi:hypothetical protein